MTDNLTISKLNSDMAGVSLTVLVGEVSSFSYSKGTAIKVQFKDPTGTIDFIDWNRKTEGKFLPGKVYSVKMNVTSYQGKLQANVTTFELCPDKDVMSFAAKTRFDTDAMFAKVLEIINDMEDPYIRYVSMELLAGEFATFYKKAPAARVMHNAYFGGLIEHALQLTDMGLAIHALYQLKFLPELNQDKIIFGCLFHDWGKMFEYDINNPAYPNTFEGELLPHIVQGPAMVHTVTDRLLTDACALHTDSTAVNELLADLEGFLGDDMNPIDHIGKTRNELMHIIASHHGTEEWGSPVRPKTMEAIIVHHLDNLDAKVMHAVGLLKKPPVVGASQDMTERSFFEKVSFVRQGVLS
jgi:3'-5' exoribonuclease